MLVHATMEMGQRIMDQSSPLEVINPERDLLQRLDAQHLF